MTMRLVPEVPTDRMCVNGAAVLQRELQCDNDLSIAHKVYAAMLDAAPAASGGELVRRLQFIADHTHGVTQEEIEEVCELAAAALARSEGWIAVSERLPDGFCNVLYANVLGTVGETHAHTIRHCFNDAKRNDEECVFTYWQPMPPHPAPPK